MLCCPGMFVHTVLTNLLFPPACLLCHTRLCRIQSDAYDDGVFCVTCREGMPRLSRPLCHTCGVGLSGAFDAVTHCSTCRTTQWAFEAARAPWTYAGALQEAVKQFKYARRWRIGRWLAETMVETARTTWPMEDIGVVLPVPRHWLKCYGKGWNPSAALAATVAQELDKPYAPQGLTRRRWTSTQTHLSWRGRFRNVRRAFVAQPRLVAHRSVLLIDDVLTSGATTNACALAMKAAGARSVFVLTAARTPLA